MTRNLILVALWALVVGMVPTKGFACTPDPNAVPQTVLGKARVCQPSERCSGETELITPGETFVTDQLLSDGTVYVFTLNGGDAVSRNIVEAGLSGTAKYYFTAYPHIWLALLVVVALAIAGRERERLRELLRHAPAPPAGRGAPAHRSG